jgi:N-hydroxyarylamine O-acetyltransferase
MNGLLDWALGEIGFKVTRMAGGVMRAIRGDDALGNHLVLWVHLDQPYMADVGFGDGLVEPVPITAGEIRQKFLTFQLEDMGDGWWRFHNSPGGGAPSFDFRMVQAAEALLDAKCAWLQSDPLSPFVQNAVVQRHLPSSLAMMRGLSLKIVGQGEGTHEIASAAEYVATLDRVFGLALPDAQALWPKIQARHRELFG